MSTMLEWPKRPKRSDTDVARRRVWLAKCRQYQVIHSHITYAEGVLPDVFVAELLDPLGWKILGRHRTRNAAMRHCQQHAKQRKGAV